MSSENTTTLSSENFNLAWHVYKYSIETPHAVAVVGEDSSITYAELAKRAAQMAHYLKSSNQWHEQAAPPRVGILGTRTIDTYVGIVAACWAGATYVPLGNKLPQERLITIMSLCNFSAIIADADGAKLLGESVLEQCPPKVLVPNAGNIKHSTPANVDLVDIASLPLQKMSEPTWMNKEDTAYIIFTSGTTGVPKGVMITLDSARHLLVNIVKAWGLTAADRFLCMCDLTFDPSVSNMFATWMVGAAFHILPANRVMNAIKFARAAQITVWFSVPSVVGLFRQVNLLNTNLPHLRLSLFGGEQLTEGVVTAWQKAAPNSVIYNVYGPAEVTVISHLQRVTYPLPLVPGRDSMFIGTTIPSCEAAVFDESGNSVLDGVKGELALAGVQLATGYLNEPQLTAARFPTIRGKRWYLTGDLAIREPSGVFQCLGRLDNQVKVLGNRIELEDVDSHLRHITNIELVGTITWPVIDGVAHGLVAFVGALSIESKQVIAELKKRVPAYMVPSKIHAIENMPFNQSGKIDCKALRQLLQDGLI